MLKSMTGYGRTEIRDKKYGNFFVEVQSINRKYCDISINLPKNLLMLESKVREVILDNIARGRISVYVGQEKSYGAGALKINMGLAKKYYKEINKVKKELKLKGDIDINCITSLKDFFVADEAEIDPLKIWPVIEKALKSALEKFQYMRAKEGEEMSKKVENSLCDIEKRLKEVKDAYPQIEECFKQKIINRIREVGISVTDADIRVQKEVAIIAERSDVTEEQNRMQSHLLQFRGLMKKKEPVGKTLDFLIQEMMREINTMGNKAAHENISKHIIYIKSELEKIREQIQNIE